MSMVQDENRSCQGCPSAGECSGSSGDTCSGAPSPMKKGIKRVIAVGSGKGGVGKSSVAALLAVGLAKRGFSVGILDSDITGPSIPQLFGLSGRLSAGPSGKILPLRSGALGIAVVSMNLLLENPQDPVVWRGPLIGEVVQQFWNDVMWDGLDWLVVDLPPGTADAPLTVMQTVALDGMLIVTTPQELSSLIVGKQARLAEMMKIPLVGMVENMAVARCPHCGQEFPVFGPSHAEEIQKKFGIPTVVRIPINSDLALLGDQGAIETFDDVALLRALVDSACCD